MRICYIGDGESVHNHFMVKWFSLRGHDLLFITDTPSDRIVCETRQAVWRKGGGGFRHLLAAWRTRSFISQWKPEIVHAHNVTGYGYWGALSGFSPLVITSWGSDLLLLPNSGRQVYAWILYTLKRADLITADAVSLCEIAKNFAGKQSDVRLLQWGVDLSEFAVQIPPTILERYRGHADVVFISTRRLRSLYNIDSIIKAFSVVLSHHPTSRLIVVGDDLQKQELKELCRGLGIMNQVYFTGWLERDEYIQALRSSDIFLSVPSSDSTALSLLEAFAAKLPVIVSDLPANREWVTHQKNGLFVDPTSIDQLSDAMIDLAHDLIRRKEWGLKNRSIVEERGNREIEMTKLEGWYRDLIDRRTATG